MILVLASLGGLWLLICLLLYLVQRRIVFPAPAPVAEIAMGGVELVSVPGPAAGPVSALFVPPAERDGRVVVTFHGNSEQLAWQGYWLAGLSQGGLGVLAVEYPGYGPMHDQATSEESILEAARAAVEWLRQEHGFGSDRIGLLGRSLGSGPATALAAEGWGDRLVLLSPFTSLVAMARKVAPVFPVGLLMRDRFDNAARARDVSFPVLVVHGTEDAVVPFAQGRALADRFQNASFHPLENVGHNDLPLEPSGPLMLRIVEFLDPVD